MHLKKKLILGERLLKRNINIRWKLKLVSELINILQRNILLLFALYLRLKKLTKTLEK